MYSAKPPGHNFKNFAKPFSGMIYKQASLFGNEMKSKVCLKLF